MLPELPCSRCGQKWVKSRINNAVVGCANINGATLGGMVFSEFRLEGSPFQLFNLAIKSSHSGFISGKATIHGLTFRNFAVPKTPVIPGLLNGNVTATGEVKSITFDNLVIAGSKVTQEKDKLSNPIIVRQGKTSAIKFQ